MSDPDELKPARPDVQHERRPAYMPSLPWLWILGIAGFLSFAFVFYAVSETRAANELRAQVMRVHQGDLGADVQRFQELVARVNGLVLAAGRKDEPTTYVAKKFDPGIFSSQRGLYMRVPFGAAQGADSLVQAVLGMDRDAITQCLGARPSMASELYSKGSFLHADWIAQAEDTDSVMKLRVIEEELRQRIERDLPAVREALEARWFMLVLQRGPERRNHPVDVYLWSLEDYRPLMRGRIQARGVLVAARSEIGGRVAGPQGPAKQSGAAQDCSIASGIRALGGRGMVTFDSEPPPPPEDAGVAPAEPTKASRATAGVEGESPGVPAGAKIPKPGEASGGHRPVQPVGVSERTAGEQP